MTPLAAGVLCASILGGFTFLLGFDLSLRVWKRLYGRLRTPLECRAVMAGQVTVTMGVAFVVMSFAYPFPGWRATLGVLLFVGVVASTYTLGALPNILTPPRK
jgi:hypothetical protein